MGALLIGYDVETQDPGSPITAQFLLRAGEVHAELGAPATLFACGRTAENNTEAFLNALQAAPFDLQQHTYDHVLLKTLCQVNHEGTSVIRGGSVEHIAESIGRANRVMLQRFGVACRGLTAPYGYYRGLSDRPDLLAIVHGMGIRFVRSWMRNCMDWVPNPIENQPFLYAPQGFPDLMEFPLTGRHDCDWPNHLGFEPEWVRTKEDYKRYMLSQLDVLQEHDRTWSWLQHDHSTMTHDPEMEILQALVRHARSIGMAVELYATVYDRAIAAQAATA